MLLQQSSFYTSQPQFPAPLQRDIGFSNNGLVRPLFPVRVDSCQRFFYPSLGSNTSYTSGFFGVGLSFSGSQTTGEFSYGSSPVASLSGATSLLVSTTVRLSSLTSSPHLVNVWGADSTYNQFLLQIGSSGEVIFGVYQDGSNRYIKKTTTGVISTNTSYTLQAYWPGGNSLELWVNGIQYDISIEVFSAGTASSLNSSATNGVLQLGVAADSGGKTTGIFYDAYVVPNIRVVSPWLRESSINPWRTYTRTDSGLQVQATGATTHTTSGALTGPGSTISGTSVHKTLHTTSGVLTGPGSTVVGVAVHPHKTAGVLTGPGSTIAGTSTRFRAHSTTGTLTGAGAAVVGSATRAPHAGTHTTSGVLTGQGSTVSGTSVHKTKHVTSGAIVGPGSSIVGSAKHPHITSGVLSGGSAIVVGTAHRGAITTHTTSGTLTGQGAAVSSESSQQTLTHADLVAISNAVWNRLTDTTYTSGDLLRLIAAMAAGRVSGAQTGTEIFRDVGDTKARITATVDAKGNRTSINLDPT